jgi:hypothetical protein
MIEKFSNLAVNVLSAAMTTTATSCSLTDAFRFPASGSFRIKIDDELLIVTAVAGNTFTVARGAEGTTARSHAAGAFVRHLLTKGGLEARVANRFISDLYDNKPAAGVKGRLFLPTDGQFLEYDDGAAWHKYGPYKRLKAPPQTGWSWVNQGNATATFVGSALVLEDPDLDATNPQIRLYVRPLTVGATSLTAAFTYNGIGTDAPCMGICARDVGGSDDANFTGLGLRLAASPSNPMTFLHFKHYTSPTAVEATPSGDSRQLMAMRLFWLKYEWAGNYKRWYLSADGVNWIKWFEDTLTSYNTPTQFGVFIDPVNNAQKVSLSLVHWEES